MRIKKLLCFTLLLCIIFTALPAVSAEAADDSRFADKSWEEVIDVFFEEHGTDPDRVGLGYYNTVTGEEHYHNGDKYMVSGSMFKVPLNMYFTEKIYNGEMDWDTKIAGVTYDKLLEWTIVNSDNQMAEYLWRNIGTYHHYREVICPYMGVEADTVDEKYYENNFFTSEQMIYCLRTLYEGGERFPRLLDTMAEAEPENYFNYSKQNFKVAHKYGYMPEGYKLYMNDCAIVYTDDPIAIVMFTDTISQPYETMTDFCTLMCDYTQYHTKLRHEEETRQAEAAAIAEMESSSQDTVPGDSTSGAEVSRSSTNGGSTIGNVIGVFIAALALIIFAAIAITTVLRHSRRGKMNKGWGLAAVIFTLAAMLLSIVGMNTGTLISKPAGDPQESVTGFFDSVISGNYTEAYSHISDYNSLGLENTPETETGRMVYDALRKSYSYKLHGECSRDGLNASQQVLIQYLDLTAISGEVETLTGENLEQIVQKRPRNEVYDEFDHYLPDVTSEAYSKAVEAVLSHAADYYTTKGVELQLRYQNGAWVIVSNDALLSALLGGTAY